MFSILPVREESPRERRRIEQHGKQTGGAGSHCPDGKPDDLLAITETWWDESHDWNAVIDDYKLFRRNRQGRRGGGVAVDAKTSTDCTELSLKNSNVQVKSLWVKIRNQAKKGNFVVGVYYRPPNQEEEVDEEFFLELLTGPDPDRGFNYLDICWKSGTANCKQPDQRRGTAH
ncbi:mitochondrial fission process protein 1 [Limosa lapponica baueri]|uniref:Mitochondrial fission process protein 1 n=1 Tax=Limosa lapponica baueri TaxID=1758121 RepID=A0A2I0TGP0_LIMLA|nr:mitochondrial fission process protein 1 [Limosa lapponica baueri]